MVKRCYIDKAFVVFCLSIIYLSLSCFLSSVFLFICCFYIILYYYYLFCTVESVIPPCPFLERVQLLQNDAQKYVILRLMCCLAMVIWRLGKGSKLNLGGWGLLLHFIFLIRKNFLLLVVCCIFNVKIVVFLM